MEDIEALLKNAQPPERWTIAEYDARVIVKMDDGRHFEILLSQSSLAKPATREEALEVARMICDSVNLAEHLTTIFVTGDI